MSVQPPETNLIKREGSASHSACNISGVKVWSSKSPLNLCFSTIFYLKSKYLKSCNRLMLFELFGSFSFAYLPGSNLIGSIIFTLTAFPFCLPASHFGIDLITRIASVANSGQSDTFFRPLISVYEPSFSTTKSTYTLP